MESPRLLWHPSQSDINQSNLFHYLKWLRKNKGLDFAGYTEVWEWSVNHIEAFWESQWQYHAIIHEGSYSNVLSGAMPECNWFEGTQLSYAEHIFRKETNDHPALLFKKEAGQLKVISWRSLREQVAAVQQYFKSCGIKSGDRIVAYMPATPEATIAFLAANALGAIWSSCSPDFGATSVVDRFAQITPKILIAADSYQYGGKTFDKSEVIRDLTAALPNLEHVVVVSEKNNPVYDDKRFTPWSAIVAETDHHLTFTRVPFSHPIWVLYSSGTTGAPKAIVHSTGGILIEQLKYGAFHNDFKSGDKCFWYTTTGWMMWNYIHGSLLAGGIMVLFDGSPAYPDINALWKFVEEAGITHFGTSAGFILANVKAENKPASTCDLSSLRSIGSTGSTLPPEGFDWVYREVKKELWLTSMSGGTDVCSAFVGGNPTWPVYAGEIQCRALGCKLEAYDEDGKPVTGEVGEMVITHPMPSMPVFFWNDPEHKRYRESYFEMFPNIWRHGDWIEITPRHGVIIYGRSDATLNRGGVRIGTSEVYRAVDKVKEVKDSLIVCIEKDGGEFWMPLFVVMQDGHSLTDELKKRINTVLRTDYSPRHVPDEIISVPDIPYTISGKKTETPVKKILMGKKPKDAVTAGALRNPESINFFVNLVPGK